MQIERDPRELSVEDEPTYTNFSHTTIGYPAGDQEDSRRSSRALMIPEEPSPSESPARGSKPPVRKDAEKRREQNRAA